MHKLSAVAALVAALQSADAVHPLFVCPSCDPSAADAGDDGGVIRVRGGGMGGEGGGMHLGGGGGGGMCCAAGGGMGGGGGGMGGASGGGMGGFGTLFGFHLPDCPDHQRKSASRHAHSKLSSCSN
jgi:hypothetical protein